MRRVPVEGVVDGLVLARAVEDRLGRVLLVKGDALQARYRDKLRDWGISEVYVEGEADPQQEVAQLLPPSAAPEGGDEGLAARLERRFSDHAQNPVMAGLKLLALKHLGGGAAKA